MDHTLPRPQEVMVSREISSPVLQQCTLFRVSDVYSPTPSREDAELFTPPSVQPHEQDQYARVAIHIFGIYGYPLHDSNLCILLERAENPREIPIRSSTCSRQEEGRTQGLSVWDGGSGSCAALLV